MNDCLRYFFARKFLSGGFCDVADDAGPVTAAVDNLPLLAHPVRSVFAIDAQCLPMHSQIDTIVAFGRDSYVDPFDLMGVGLVTQTDVPLPFFEFLMRRDFSLRHHHVDIFGK